MNGTTPIMDYLERVVKIIKDVGFPIVVAIYLLIRIDPILRELTLVIGELSQTVGSVSRVLEETGRRLERLERSGG